MILKTAENSFSLSSCFSLSQLSVFQLVDASFGAARIDASSACTLSSCSQPGLLCSLSVLSPSLLQLLHKISSMILAKILLPKTHILLNPLTTIWQLASASTSTTPSTSINTCALTFAHVKQSLRPETGRALRLLKSKVTTKEMWFPDLSTLPELTLIMNSALMVLMRKQLVKLILHSMHSLTLSEAKVTSKPSKTGSSSSKRITAVPVFANLLSSLGRTQLLLADQLNLASAPSRTTLVMPSRDSLSLLSSLVSFSSSLSSASTASGESTIESLLNLQSDFKIQNTYQSVHCLKTSW